MKRILIIASFTILICIIILLFIKSPSESHDLPSQSPPANWLENFLAQRTNSQTSGSVKAGLPSKTSPEKAADSLLTVPSNAPGSHVALPVSIPSLPEFTNLPPEIVLENVRTVFRSYQSMFRENPVGTNPEITRQLNGGNIKQAHFLSEEEGLRINTVGELIDPWGTPYFFHQLSGAEMEIHSAGPDRVLWTSDDLVSK